MFAALAVAREVQNRTGLSIRQVVRQLRPLRSAIIAINGTSRTFPPVIPTEQQAILDALPLARPPAGVEVRLSGPVTHQANEPTRAAAVRPRRAASISVLAVHEDVPVSLDVAAAHRVRAALLGCGYTAEGVRSRIGEPALNGLGRALTAPARRALDRCNGPPDPAAPADPAASAWVGTPADPAAAASTSAPADPAAAERRSTLDALIRLFLLGEPQPRDALGGALAADLRGLGLVGAEPDGRLVAVLDVRPYGESDTDWYLVSDVGPALRADHVLGLGGASRTLARITPRSARGRVLDLGCGSGVQALHAARHARRVVATDTNPHALECTALTLALSGVDLAAVDLREGSLYEPVIGERFDLVVANPPFVISPAPRFTYRDGGLPGDELCASVVRGAAEHLAPGGCAVILANWLHVTGQDWRDRVKGWVAGTGATAWIVQREVQSSVDYSATWLRDAGVPEGRPLQRELEDWLAMFDRLDADAVGFGWLVLQARAGTPGAGLLGDPAHSPWVLVEDLAGAARLPDGEEVEAFLAGCSRVDELGAAGLLASRARVADGTQVVRVSQVVAGDELPGPPRLGGPAATDAAGWRPLVPVPEPVLRALSDDADESLGERLDRAAQVRGLDPLDVLPTALMGLRELLRVGIVRTDRPGHRGDLQ